MYLNICSVCARKLHNVFGGRGAFFFLSKRVKYLTYGRYLPCVFVFPHTNHKDKWSLFVIFIYCCNTSIYSNFFPRSKNWITRDRKGSRRLRVMTYFDAGLWSELQLHLLLCCLLGVSLSVNCLLVSYFISQRIKMQALRTRGKLEDVGNFSGEFSLDFQPSHYTKPLLDGWLLSI